MVDLAFTPPTAHFWVQRTWRDTLKGKYFVYGLLTIYLLTYFILFRSPNSKLASTWPLPSNEGCRLPDVDIDGSWDGLAGWEQVGNARGDPWYGRPARYVRRGAIIGSPTFTNFHSVYILTLKTCLDTPPYPPLYARALALPPLPSHARPSRRWSFMAFRHHSHQFHLPRMAERAGGGFMGFQHHLYPLHLPRMLDRAPCPPLRSLPPSHATARRGWILVTLSEPLTSQGCTAVSIDTCTALARLLGQFWSHTRAWVCVPPGFLKPLPQPVKTRTLECGCGFRGYGYGSPWNTPGLPVTIAKSMFP
jgi:hypothetical protein